MSNFISSNLLFEATNLLSKILENAKVPESHGIKHAQQVLNHMQNALISNEQSSSGVQITENRKLSCLLGALLHDADDRKYFSQNIKYNKNDELKLKYCNAYNILCELFGKQSHIDNFSVKSIIDDTLNMISFVSTSQNGNNIPQIAIIHPELIWPRFCDRLEAIGMIGAIRCYQYTIENDRILEVPGKTPRPQNEEELWNSYVTDYRFDQYQQTGKSDSMMDHYFDKLLQIARLDNQIVQNDYIIKEAKERVQPLVDICIQYGKSGQVPLNLIKQYMNK